MRKRLVEIIGGRDDVVWPLLRSLADGARAAADLLERRLHHGADQGAAGRELATAALRSDDTLRELRRHLHNAFAAPLERDDALALGSAFDRATQACADIGAALDVRGVDRGRHEAQRASALISIAIEGTDLARAELAAGCGSAGARADARTLLADARGFIRQGLADVLDAGLPVEQLLSWKDIYDRLDLALAAARDAERLVDAIA